MQFPLETLAALATIVGTAISLLALLQSRACLLLTSLLVVCLAILVVLYARKQRLALDAASTVIEGRSIDSLNIANLRRRVNRTFVIQEAHHTARIEDGDLEITWKYSGYCRSDSASEMEFSIDTENNVAFKDLDCVAFDLGHDPDMTHAIRPVLVGTEGLSKKIAVPFLEPLSANQPFGLLLKCTLPGCITPGFGYYTSTLSFAQKRVRRCTVHLIFKGPAPSWLRVYESTLQKPAALVKTLAPSRQEHGLYEYLDVAENRRGQSARVYAFWRDPG
ncbi:MAG TPA: hypothetical protein VMF32_10545 [Xanthobacteraceae bacterium]|nr:hypothetical protein [Xanthobacteraceae bacterium]